VQSLSSVDLVIFDCDGVLVDSEVIFGAAHAETLTRHGYPITSDQVLERFLGVSDREARETIETELGRPLADDFESQMNEAALRRYTEDLRAIPYIDEAIAAIDLPKCVASSGTPEKIRHGLGCAGLYDQLAPLLRLSGQARQAGARSVPARRRTDAGRTRALRGDRGQPCRHRRRGRRRDARARLSRRQPLPPWPRRPAARRRRCRGIRRYAAVAGANRAN
jgi:hypothetical protein